MTTSTLPRTTTSWRLPLARAKRGGWLAMMAVCKLALLLSMIKSAGQALESNCENLESLTVVTVNALDGQVSASRTKVAKTLAVRCLRRAPGLAGSGVDRPLRGSRKDGHRLPNGLCAPMQC
jgi:hypothetical protein